MINIIRFAPSPSGFIHIGNIKILLYCLLISKILKSFFLLRIDDTNFINYKIYYVKNILYDLNKIKIFFNKNLPIFQSNKIYRYNEIIQYIFKKHLCYISYNNENKFKFYYIYIKFNIKNKLYNIKYIFYNFYKKFVIKIFSILKNKKNDYIILKYNKIPTYNISCIIDDNDMNINYIIRGKDHINNLLKQINIIKFLNKNLPNYIHIPLFINKKGKKIRKKNIKKNWIKNYLYESFVIYILNNNFNNYKNNKSNFICEIKKIFNIKKIKKTYLRFDLKNLEWHNKNLIKNINLNLIFYVVKNFLFKKIFFKKKIFLNKKFFIKNYRIKFNNIKNLSLFLIIVIKNKFLNYNILKFYLNKKIFILSIKFKKFKNIYYNEKKISFLINKNIKKLNIKKFIFLTILKIFIFQKKILPPFLKLIKIKKKIILKNIKINIKNIKIFINSFRLMVRTSFFHDENRSSKLLRSKNNIINEMII